MTFTFGEARALNAAGGAFSGEEVALLARYNARAGTARAFSRSVRDVINGWGQHRHFLDRAHEVAALPPIALFWGDEDPLIPIAHGLEAESLIEGITLTRFPRVGHFPHRQAPARFVEALGAFLDAHHLPDARLREPVPEIDPRRAKVKTAQPASLSPRRWPLPRPR